MDNVTGDRRTYYEQVFRTHSDGGWDTAPGKEVLLNAVARTRLGLPLAGQACDIGCGTGLLLRRLRDELLPDWQFTGVDFSEVAIARAKAVGDAIRFLAADGSATGLPADSMDLVVSYGSFEHFPDPGRGVAEMARLLRPGGRFYTMMPTLEAYWQGASEEEGWFADKGGQLQWNLRRATWEDLFRKAGLDLLPADQAARYGALNPEVFFLGTRPVS